MADFATIPTIIWNVTRLSTAHTEMRPTLFLMGMKWRLNLTQIWEPKSGAKFQLKMERLSVPHELKDVTFNVETSIEGPNGARALGKNTISSLQSNEWHIWTDYLTTICNTFRITVEDGVIFWIAIKPQLGKSALSRSDVKEDLSDCFLELSKDLGKLFDSGEQSDVVLKCGNKTYSAHKAVLSARSGFFAAMFRSKMKENEDDVVEIANIEPAVLEELLWYLYTGHIWNLSVDSFRKLYTVADMYLVETLKIKCISLVMKRRWLDAEDKPGEAEITAADSQPERADSGGDQKVEESSDKDKQLLKDLFRAREWETLSLENPKLAHDMCKSLLLNGDL